MRLFILLFLITTFVSFGNPIKRAHSTKELELKILEKLFYDILKKRSIRVLILGNKREYYIAVFSSGSEYLKPVGGCEEADIVFIAGHYEGGLPKKCNRRPAFSTRREHIFRWKEVIGAFYWKKGRPNLLLIRERLEERDIDMPGEYRKFIESLGRIHHGGSAV